MPGGVQLLERHAYVALGRLVHEGPPALGVHPKDELGLRVHYRAIARLARRERPGLGPGLRDVALDRHVVCGVTALLLERGDGGLLLDQVAVPVAVDDRALPGPPSLELTAHRRRRTPAAAGRSKGCPGAALPSASAAL